MYFHYLIVWKFEFLKWKQVTSMGKPFYLQTFGSKVFVFFYWDQNGFCMKSYLNFPIPNKNVDHSPQITDKVAADWTISVSSTTKWSQSVSRFAFANCPYLFHPAPKTMPSSVLTTVCRAPAYTAIGPYWLSKFSSCVESVFGRSITIGEAKTVAHFWFSICFSPFFWINSHFL